MKKQKMRWLLGFLLLVVFLTGGVWVYRDTLMLWIAPRAVLSRALSDALSALDERFQNHPLKLVMEEIDPEGKYTADVTLNTTNDILGSIQYAMTVHTNAADHQMLAEGMISSDRRNLDLNLYLDQQFMAVSSLDLVKGSYYGITYDSFDADIRKIPLLDFFVSDRIISQWDASVQSVKKAMSKNYVLPAFPDIQKEKLQLLLVGMMALPCDIEKTTVAVRDQYVECRLFSYSAAGKEVDSILAEMSYPSGSKIDAKFYLLEKELIKVTVICSGGGRSTHITLDLSEDLSCGCIDMQITQSQSGVVNQYSITVDTKQTQPEYRESWIITDGEGTIRISFSWDPSRQMLQLQRDDQVSASLQIQETESGLQMETKDLRQLMAVFSESGRGQGMTSKNPMECKMMVKKGSDILTPPYRSPDQWSIEDFLILLEGLGSLIGIRVN